MSATERGGFEVTCPCCHAVFVARRPERPFRHATPASVAGPPDVRREPRNPRAAIFRCDHCASEFWPARGTRRPRYCSRSCARRAALARKHGFDPAELEQGHR